MQYIKDNNTGEWVELTWENLLLMDKITYEKWLKNNNINLGDSDVKEV